MIISFSGLDGAGKTTQIQMLLEYYKSQGAKIGSIYKHFPDIRYHNKLELKKIEPELHSCDVILMRYRLNSNRNNFIMHHLEKGMSQQHLLSTIAALQGYQDHSELNKYIISSLLSDNKTVIFDRYYYDELAFKYVYGCSDLILENLYKNVQDADIKFYIDISAQECLQRNQSRPDSNIPLYQNEKYVKQLIERFDDITKRKHLITLNGMEPKEIIAQSVLKYINIYSFSKIF